MRTSEIVFVLGSDKSIFAIVRVSFPLLQYFGFQLHVQENAACCMP
jgi:recombinational DNA repair protein (RecF pathway)